MKAIPPSSCVDGRGDRGWHCRPMGGRTTFAAMEMKEIIMENERRKAALQVPYDPEKGVGCCGCRVQVDGVWVPQAVLDECPGYALLAPLEQRRLRVRHDFEYWCTTCATVRDKLTGRPIRFRLNAPQRRVLAVIEEQRMAGLPVRLILLKARQWGGSTLVQMYMAWMQLVRHTGWNSLICGHLRQSARSIKGMYRLLLRHYPRELLDDEVRVEFKNFEGSSDVQVLTGRDSLVIMGTAVSEDAVRGYSLAMAHLTEVAFWPETAMHSPQDVMRTVNGTVTRTPDTVVALESTANGVGQFFHTEWLRACSGQSDKVPVFVPWYEIELYRAPVGDVQHLWDTMDDYERRLWHDGRTLEMIQWYHDKRKEAASHAAMMAEFPTTDTEAFVATDHGVFDREHLERLRRHCQPPQHTGDVEADYKTVRNVHWVDAASGLMKVWRMPEPGGRYVVAVDIGGRSDQADYSVIAVLDVRDPSCRRPEVVAQWRGHLDHDLLAWKAAQVATFYHRATLVVESNTLETGRGTEGNDGKFLLHEVARSYPAVYRRDTVNYGFHTNVRTKRNMIYNLIAAVRDGTYVERDSQAIDEMATYEQTGNGGYEAKKGHHDDILITRAIALWVAHSNVLPRATLSSADMAVLAPVF